MQFYNSISVFDFIRPKGVNFAGKFPSKASVKKYKLASYCGPELGNILAIIKLHS